MLHLYTFCVDIGRHSKTELINVLKILIHSLDKTNEYQLHIFTNFDININDPNIVLHKYFDNNLSIYQDRWLNLSFNKIYIYKYLFDKYKIDFTWVDLDTVFTSDVSYINDISSFFIDCGGTNEDPHLLINNTNIYIARNKWIQGNIWKLNIELYNKLIDIYNKISLKNLKFEYDLQSLFTYYFYFILDGNEKTLLTNGIYIIGRNIKKNVINGLCIWDPKGNTHANFNGLNNLYYENKLLKSNFYPDKDIHLVSFTFYTLKQLYNTKKFKELFINN
tara:strand:- start:3440 stop:4270 length:831 start_codon:yes stop_codon:yes gene_type:complete